MRKKVLLTVLCIVVVILLKLICDYILNTIQVNSYKEEKYNADLAQLVATLKFNKSHAANYNYGNVLYQKGDYGGAIEQYKNALDTIVPSGEECDIRVNYALAICKTVKLEKEDEKDEEKVKEAIKKYESAIDVLVAVECAHRNDNNGHDKDAQQLKNDIQKAPHFCDAARSPKYHLAFHHNYDGFSQKTCKMPDKSKRKNMTVRPLLKYRRNSGGFAELFSAENKIFLA